MNALTEQLSNDVAGLTRQNERLTAALKRTLSWLTSYPGGGAMGAYDQARAALNEAKEKP